MDLTKLTDTQHQTYRDAYRAAWIKAAALQLTYSTALTFAYLRACAAVEEVYGA